VSVAPDVATSNSCASHAGPGVTEPGNITADTTWTAADSPHLVTSSFTVRPGATLTIEPCAEVRVGNDVDMTVDGALIAEGTASTPIHFVADDATKPWAYLRFTSGTGRLAYVTFEGGGKSDPNAWGTIEVRNTTDGSNRELLRVDHVTITGSERYGLSLTGGGELTADSTALTITGAKLAPIRIDPRLASNLPDGQYTGNAKDEIVLTSQDVTTDTTFHDLGVPYEIGDDPVATIPTLRVQAAASGSVATLTIDPGVTWRFGQGGSLLIETFTGDSPARGALVAVGAADKPPIVFTSALDAPAAGAWGGIWYGGVPDARNKLDYVHVDFAGGPSNSENFHCELDTLGQVTASGPEDAAIIITNVPSGEFVTHTSITASAGYGIDRGWNGPPIDFTATNDFHQIAKCEQSEPRDVQTSPTIWGCPQTVTCIAAP
jgi:hypothetical protein